MRYAKLIWRKLFNLISFGLVRKNRQLEKRICNQRREIARLWEENAYATQNLLEERASKYRIIRSCMDIIEDRQSSEGDK